MKVRVRLFAVARELSSCDSLEIELPEGSTIGDLRAAVAKRVPAIQEILPGVMFAIGTSYASNKTPLEPDAEVACIPPVSGG
ncbi:MAG TPA: MoaD/ThiS family protein [Pirellulales bacterium]|nr:MoaD/ThiS family protein [Pirellulales bacterium]